MYITKIRQDKKGLFIVIPKSIIRKLKWKVGDVVEWKVENSKIYLTKVKQ